MVLDTLRAHSFVSIKWLIGVHLVILGLVGAGAVGAFGPAEAAGIADLTRLPGGIVLGGASMDEEAVWSSFVSVETSGEVPSEIVDLFGRFVGETVDAATIENAVEHRAWRAALVQSGGVQRAGGVLIESFSLVPAALGLDGSSRVAPLVGLRLTVEEDLPGARVPAVSPDGILVHFLAEEALVARTDDASESAGGSSAKRISGNIAALVAAEIDAEPVGSNGSSGSIDASGAKALGVVALVSTSGEGDDSAPMVLGRATRVNTDRSGTDARSLATVHVAVRPGESVVLLGVPTTLWSAESGLELGKNVVATLAGEPARARLVSSTQTDKQAVQPGEALTFTLRLANVGAGAATDVQTGVSVPAQLQLITESVRASTGEARWDAANGRITWRIDHVPIGGVVTLSYEAVVR